MTDKEKLERERKIAIEHLELVANEKERIVIESLINGLDMILKTREENNGKDTTVSDSEEGSSQKDKG